VTKDTVALPSKSLLGLLGLLLSIAVIVGSGLVAHGGLVSSVDVNKEHIGSNTEKIEELEKSKVNTDRFQDFCQRIDRIETKIDQLLSRKK